MESIPARELSARPGEVWRKLRDRRELAVTSLGQPIALLIDVKGDLEQALAAIRRARAQLAVARLRATARAAGLNQLGAEQIEAEIRAARQESPRS